MKPEIRPLRKRDYEKAIRFAVVGMHFNAYMDSPWVLQLYGKYFWYMELESATQVIAAYDADELVGVLLADMKGEPKAIHSPLRSAYVKAIDFLQGKLFPSGVDPYNDANRAMLKDYCRNAAPDGEINFLAADPDRKARGVGTALLDELARREAGKQVYLYTDNNCTWQFYEHRGFRRVGERNVLLDFDVKKVPIDCFLYSKTLA